MNVRENGSVQQPMLTCFRSRSHGYRIMRLTVVRGSQRSECEPPCYISLVSRYQSPPILRLGMELRKSAETRDVEVGHAENSNECYKLTPSQYYVVTDLDQGRSTCTPLTLCLQWLLRQRRSESSGQLITKRQLKCDRTYTPTGHSTNTISYLFLDPGPSASSSTYESRRRQRRIIFISI